MTNMKKNRTGLVLWCCLFVGALGVSPLNGQTGASSAPDQRESGRGESPRTSAYSLGDSFFQNRNALMSSISITGRYDDNLFNTATRPLRDYFVEISPRLAAQRDFGRSSFAMDFIPGLRFYRDNPELNTVTQQGGLDLSASLSRRVRLAIQDRASVTPDTFRTLNFTPILANVDVTFSPNTGIFLERNIQIANLLSTSIEFQKTARTSFRFGSSYAIQRFTNPNLVESDQYGAVFNYSYQLSRRTTLGFGYRFSYIEFLGRSGIGRVHSPTLDWRRTLGRKLSVGLSVGPTFLNGVTSQALTATSRVLLFVFGDITLTQPISTRTFASINVNRNYGDFGGLGTISENSLMGGSLGHLLTRKLSVAIGGGHFWNATFLGQPYRLRSYFGSAKLTYNALESLGVFVEYAYRGQKANQVAVPGGFGVFSANSANVGLTYRLPVASF